ncbi:MAG: DUF4402 domain-containing protein [Bacteroidetes bacterium]|nr:DUF4402 domain-containing protein [Bacteroidota bacterium]
MSKQFYYNIKFLTFLFIVIIQLLSLQTLRSQPGLPTRSIAIIPTQSISFGAFCLINSGSSGGTVQVDWQGNRLSTGQIFLLNTYPWHPAIFEIHLCQGRNVVITYSSSTTLTGSNGGSITLNIGPTEKGGNGSSFAVNNDCNFITILRVGGTLIIANNASNPAGYYTGNFSITFNQQ